MTFRLNADTVGRCYFSENFSGHTARELPEEWISYGAGKTASDSYAGSIPLTSENRLMRLCELFPDNSQSFVMLDLDGNGTTMPFCNSTTKEGGEVNEWLISPVIDTSDASGELLLSFDVVCFGSYKAAPFSVYVGEYSSTSPEGFKNGPVYSGSFKGSTSQIKKNRVYVSIPNDAATDGIRLAFVCNASGAQLMGFSSFMVSDYEVEILNNAPDFTMVTGNMNLPLSIDLHYPGKSESVDCVLRYLNGEKSETFAITGGDALNLHLEHTFKDAFTLDYTSDISYEIIVKPKPKNAIPYKKTFRIVCREGYPSVCVMEEATGSWCPACVRGIAAFEKYNDQWGDRFIGIAVHNSDEMAIDSYDPLFREYSGISSFPSGWFNRKTVDSPTEESIVKEILDFNCAYQIEIDNVTWDESDKTIEVDFSAKCCHSLEDSKLAVAAVLLQNKYIGRYQKNGLSGMTQQQAGHEWWPYFERFSKSENMIAPFEFDHVARGIFPSIDGDTKLLPSSFQAEKTECATLLFKIPDFYEEPNKNTWQDTAVVLLLIDSSSGHILTADKAYGHEYSVKGASINPVVHERYPVSVRYTDLLGRIIKHPQPGSLYIKTVRYDDNSEISTKTLIK